MNKIVSLFTSDLIRKLVAIGFAFMLWFYVQGMINVDRQVKFDITTLSQTALGTNSFTLRVKAPEGWKLTSPASGDTVSIWFRGAQSELQDFTARQCSASINVHFDADSTQHRIDVNVAPSDLDWLRPGDAQYLLKNVNRAQSLQKMTFERVIESVHVLNSFDITIVGEAASTHRVETQSTRFNNHSQVTLSGPKFSMDSLLQQIDPEDPNNPMLKSSGLLSPLRVAANTRQDVQPRLHLADKWRKAGIRMNPPHIDVSVPVRLKQSAKFVWLPVAADLQVLDDDANAGLWQVQLWEPTQWIAELPSVSATDVDINAQWISDHVILILPMNALSANSLELNKIRVQAILVGFDNDDDHRYFQKNIRIRALQPDDAMV
ncbi:MAG: hypothetical protein ACI84O_001392, partial [Myxococcota bacterium]